MRLRFSRAAWSSCALSMRGDRFLTDAVWATGDLERSPTGRRWFDGELERSPAGRRWFDGDLERSPPGRRWFDGDLERLLRWDKDLERLLRFGGGDLERLTLRRSKGDLERDLRRLESDRLSLRSLRADRSSWRSRSRADGRSFELN